MITRIEIDGFKTFRGFALDLGPFVAVLGANAAGKSNLFDAIQFLRRVTESSLTAAVQEARGSLEDLFRLRGDGTRVQVMRFAVEVLLEPRVRDPWGTEVDLTQTRIRYELHVVKREDLDGNPRIFVEHEYAAPLRRGHGNLAVRWKASKAFVERHLVDGRRSSAFLETVNDADRGRVFQIRQDGVQGRARPAEAAEATVLSSVNSAEFKHLYALHEEMSSWRFLQLEPESLRAPAERYGEDRLLPNGANLSRVLHRIQRETATDIRPSGDLADISADLSALIPGTQAVTVFENDQTRKWETHILSEGDATYRADVASDGTLRVLALLAALYDPKYRGLICFEEPENGVHPHRLKRLIHYLRDLVTQPESLDVSDSPLAQVILNSHSPVVLASLPPSDCIFVDVETVIEDVDEESLSRRVKSRISRYRRVASGNASPLFDTGEHLVREDEIARYRAAVELEDSW